MTRIRWAVSIVGVVIVLLSVVLAVSLNHTDHSVKTTPSLGHSAPQFSLTDFNGAPLRLRDALGKVVVVNFWNDWCEPCQIETPSLVGLAAARRGDPNFAMIGIVHDERTKRAVREYAQNNKMNYALAFDPEARTSLDYSVTGQPETFVIDKHGVVSNWISGPIDPQQLDPLISQLEQAP